MRSFVSLVAGAVAAVALSASSITAQSVADVVEGMYEAYARQSEGVDDYTLVQDMMGVAAVSYFEKEIVEGHPVFRVRDAVVDGFGFGLGADDAGHGDVFLFGPELVEHGRYGGRESVDGRELHVLVVDDMSQLEMAQPAGPEDIEFVARTAHIYVDPDLMMPRRMVFVGDALTTEGPQEVTLRLDLGDYREVEGMLFAYRTVMRIEGLQAMVDPAMMAELEEMQRQMAEMPPEQRAMIEQMMGPQLEQLRQMLEGGGDAMTMEIALTEVRVNAGPPAA